MIYNIKFNKLKVVGNKLEHEILDRSKGLWIYSLHPKFTENNHNVWESVDKANSEINKVIANQDLVPTIFGSDQEELYDELELSQFKKYPLFVVVLNDKIISKSDSLSNTKEWMEEVLNSLKKKEMPVVPQEKPIIPQKKEWKLFG